MSKAALCGLTGFSPTVPSLEEHARNKLLLQHRFLAKHDCPDGFSWFFFALFIVLCVVKSGVMQKRSDPVRLVHVQTNGGGASHMTRGCLQLTRGCTFHTPPQIKTKKEKIS